MSRRPGAGRILLMLAALAGIAFLALPLLALAIRAVTSGALGELGRGPILQALLLSLVTSTVALPIVVLLGAPLAWLLARGTFRGRALVETLVDLPLVLPPSVAGLALLLAYGRRGVTGPTLEAAGIVLPFTTLAIVVVQVFVALPFFVRATRAGLAAVDRELEEAAAIDGADPAAIARRIALPLAAPAIAAGLLLAWARAIGEFGATILFAGSLPGRTQTLPLLVYAELQGSTDAAIAAASILLAAALVVLLAVRTTRWRAIL